MKRLATAVDSRQWQVSPEKLFAFILQSNKKLKSLEVETQTPKNKQRKKFGHQFNNTRERSRTTTTKANKKNLRERIIWCSSALGRALLVVTIDVADDDYCCCDQTLD